MTAPDIGQHSPFYVSNGAPIFVYETDRDNPELTTITCRVCLGSESKLTPKARLAFRAKHRGTCNQVAYSEQKAAEALLKLVELDGG